MKRSWLTQQNSISKSKVKKINEDDEVEEDYGDLDDDCFYNDEVAEEDNEGLIQESEEFAKWARLPIKGIDPTKESLIFQQIEIDHYTSKVCDFSDEASVFRMFGINKEGNSIMAHIYGYHPYLYIKAPQNFQKNQCENFMNLLNIQLKSGNVQCQKLSKPVIKVEYCMKSDIYGYTTQKIPYLCLTLALQSLVTPCKNVLQQGVKINDEEHYFEIFDGTIDLTVRYMVDSGLVGCSWVELPPNSYTIRHSKESLCQLEVEVNWDQIIYHNPEDEWSIIAPLRILSFDIECAGRRGIFPEPDKDPVIQISNMIVRYGEEEPFIKNVFTLKSCAPIVGAHVLSFETEEELLRHWSNFIREVDPDIFTGYNILNFDLPYLINRSKCLKLNNFCFLGRMKKIPSTVREAPRTRSKQMGARENKLINISGRIQFDLFQALLRDYKLRSYSLNAVSYHFLEEQKEDVAYQIISDLQNGDENTRRRLAIYCLKDAYLVLRLLKKLMCIVNYVEMARVTGVPLSSLLTRGQQIKVLSQLKRKAKDDDYVIPERARGGDESYEGATVIEPKRGFYVKPIATLDFSSLYPSIMMAHNLCYTTLLTSQHEAQRLGLSPDDYIQTPCNNLFVKSSVKKGLLPEILVQLIQARKKAKKELASETDPFKKQVLDGRQLALKISANSVYGFTGAQNGVLPCLPISSSVTAFGREMIQQTKSLVESKFCRSEGYQFDSNVIYGDTDSVMVNFGVETVKEAMTLGKEAAEYISQRFIDPIKLEFEKVYFPYLLINKKRYAGMYYTKPEKYDKMDCKGLETVRRDNCPLVASLLNSCLEKLLMNRNEKDALKHAQSTISDLLCNRIDISQLIISKELTQTNYNNNNLAHVKVAQKMKQRDPGSAPQLGDRVPYIITCSGEKKQMFEKAEDPIYVLENRIPIDTDYYLKNQLSKPLLRMFVPIYGDKKAEEKLLKGEHMLTKSQQSSKVGALAKFARPVPTCVGCRSKLKATEQGLCSYCSKQATHIYSRELVHRSSLEERFSRLWTECQRCSSSFHQEVLCTSRDCPIFYMRKKVQQDLVDQDDVMRRLNESLTNW